MSATRPEPHDPIPAPAVQRSRGRGPRTSFRYRWYHRPIHATTSSNTEDGVERPQRDDQSLRRGEPHGPVGPDHRLARPLSGRKLPLQLRLTLLVFRPARNKDTRAAVANRYAQNHGESLSGGRSGVGRGMHQVGSQLGKQRAAVERRVAQLLFDSQQLVVFGHAVRSGSRTGLDLAGPQSHRQVGNRRVFCLATAVARDTAVAMPTGQLNRVDRLGQRCRSD